MYSVYVISSSQDWENNHNLRGKKSVWLRYMLEIASWVASQVVIHSKYLYCNITRGWFLLRPKIQVEIEKDYTGIKLCIRIKLYTRIKHVMSFISFIFSGTLSDHWVNNFIQ